MTARMKEGRKEGRKEGILVEISSFEFSVNATFSLTSRLMRSQL